MQYQLKYLHINNEGLLLSKLIPGCARNPLHNRRGDEFYYFALNF